MTTRQLFITLHSDGTFGRGDGVAGLLDQEIEYDERSGLPFIRGRVIKGLLVEECANILYGISGHVEDPQVVGRLENAAGFLFGKPGSTVGTNAQMQVGNARFPERVRRAVMYAIYEKDRLTANEVLDSLTTLRRQTAVDDTRGAPDEGSLRTGRALAHGTELVADLIFNSKPSKDAEALLAACAAAWRRGGTGRNRGRGRLRARLESDGKHGQLLQHFREILGVEGGEK